MTRNNIYRSGVCTRQVTRITNMNVVTIYIINISGQESHVNSLNTLACVHGHSLLCVLTNTAHLTIHLLHLRRSRSASRFPCLVTKPSSTFLHPVVRLMWALTTMYDSHGCFYVSATIRNNGVDNLQK